MPFAAALSEHPVTVEATAEVVGDVLDRVGPEPDMAVLFATSAHVAHLADVARTVRAALAPGVLVGTTAVSVLARDREVEEQPGLALWAGTPGPVLGVRLRAVRGAAGVALHGLDLGAVGDGPATLVLLADPLSFPVDDVIEHLASAAPRLRVVGGLASAGLAPRANRFVLDDAVFDDGAVGVLVPGDEVATVVSQGCRPIGEPFVVTRAEGNLIAEIAGTPALERLDELFRRLPAEERELVQQGLHIGRVIDEHRPDFGRGDFLVRNVLGADRASGAIVIGDVVPVGATVQFHVRDARSADEDLHLLLADAVGDGALVFTCNGRGTRLFGNPDHDAEAVAQVVRGADAGMFCAGEIGPVGSRSFVHGFTASVALFRDAR